MKLITIETGAVINGKQIVDYSYHHTLDNPPQVERMTAAEVATALRTHGQYEKLVAEETAAEDRITNGWALYGSSTPEKSAQIRLAQVATDAASGLSVELYNRYNDTVSEARLVNEAFDILSGKGPEISGLSVSGKPLDAEEIQRREGIHAREDACWAEEVLGHAGMVGASRPTSLPPLA